jgi:hypothetical protein
VHFRGIASASLRECVTPHTAAQTLSFFSGLEKILALSQGCLIFEKKAWQKSFAV